jgi:hypothetical protein
MFELIEEPRLGDLQQKVATLEQEHNEAEARAAQLRAEVQEARNQDITAEALALNAGKRPPKPKEPELRAQLEGAQRRAEVLGRRLALAQSDVSKYVQVHHEELYQKLAEAERLKAQKVADGARQLLSDLSRYYQIDEDRKAMKPMLPPPPETGPPGSAEADRITTIFAGLQTSASLSSGPPRGTIEEILRHLASLDENEEEQGVA